MTKKTKINLYWAYLALCLGYACYADWSYTGLYRLVAEWQLDTFGEYGDQLSQLVVLLVLMIPGAGAAKFAGVDPIRGGRELQATLADAWAAVSPGRLAIAGLVFLAAGAGTGWYGFGVATADVTFTPFDLSTAERPPPRHVVMSGVAHTEYQVDFKSSDAAPTSTTYRSPPPAGATAIL
jgi:hypothetical protein